MTYVQKARLTFLGIDDELKNDATSVYSTVINSSFFPVPAPIAVGTVAGPPIAPAAGAAPLYDDQQYGVKAVTFTKRTNTKRMKFSLNGALNNLSLSNKAKIIIESVTIPNILSHTIKQSKCINNIQLRLRGLSRNISWDSTSKGKSTLIFSCPVFLNTQGYGETLSPNQPPDGTAAAQRPRINADNNGHLFINTSPDTLYNFNIDDSFLKNGIFEFELLYDIGNCIYNENKFNQFSYVPQTIDFDHDKDDFEQFMISIIVMDVEDDNDKLYNNEEMINKMNKLLIGKYNMK
jgi:hypothetical protein